MAILPVYSVVEEGAEASVAARAFGRKMIEQIAESQLRVNKLYRQLADGTVLIAQRAGQQYRLTILSRSRASTQAQQVAQVWSPRGFVVWPVSDAAPFGWGFPVVQDTGFNVTAYSKQNLAPGLDVARWTAAGPLPEVLLSRVTDAGYPKRKKNIAPMNFSTSHGPQPQRPPGGKRVDVQADRPAVLVAQHVRQDVQLLFALGVFQHQRLVEVELDLLPVEQVKDDHLVTLEPQVL